MKLRFLTDPHLGLSRVSHTTSASQGKLRDRLFSAVQNGLADSGNFLLGDLFHTYSNTEETISQGIEIASQCQMVLSGNHDIRNRADVMSSLQLIAKWDTQDGNGPLIPLPGGPEDSYGIKCVCYPSETGNGLLIVGIGHQLSQADFLAALECAKTYDPPMIGAYKGEFDRRILLLHCNYDCEFVTDESGATLNLPRDVAESLLDSYDYILIGHEHVPSEDFDGRLKILGNTLPLSFGEMADRFVYDYYTETDTFTKTLIFDVAKGYLEIDSGDFLNLADIDTWAEQCQFEFIQITGTMRSADYPEFGRKLAKLWRKAPNLLMVKSGVNMEKVENTADSITTVAVARTIPELIADELDGNEMAAVYLELADEERAETGTD